MIIKALKEFFFPHTDKNNPLRVDYERGIEYDAWVLSSEGQRKLHERK